MVQMYKQYGPTKFFHFREPKKKTKPVFGYWEVLQKKMLWIMTFSYLVHHGDKRIHLRCIFFYSPNFPLRFLFLKFFLKFPENKQNLNVLEKSLKGEKQAKIIYLS